MPETRPAYRSEMDYFQANPHVSGMAAGDNNVVLNPYSGLSPLEKQAVVQNELARIMMRRAPAPQYELTPGQQSAFSGYGSPEDAKATVAARLFSGDPSAGQGTPEQLAYVGALQHMMAGTNEPGAEALGQYQAEIDPVPQQRLDIARRNILSRMPRLSQDVVVQPGEGPHYAEFYSPREPMNPNLGKPTVEVFPQGMKARGQALENIVGGDILHHMAEADPQFAALRSEFVRSLSPQQLEHSRRRYQYDVENHNEKRSYQDWFDRVWADALIRGYVTPDENDEFRGTYSRAEEAKLQDIVRYLSGGD